MLTIKYIKKLNLFIILIREYIYLDLIQFLLTQHFLTNITASTVGHPNMSTTKI